ncbi:terminase gpA endonuclease subunit [Marinomonas transparens]|uniref:Phage terminase large subunit family protein n=1 Tax=Marinomonas transparens TaxID=2795388 RepID=A0A934JZ19_9GAMM|nr:terminase gpA endonuclease subunit [Marinomonas transparens]MBJ7539885.1 phage terminase large subunit family protein [Marinomonas transparens]
MNYSLLSQKLLSGIQSTIVPPMMMPIIPWAKSNENPDAQIYPPKSFQRAWQLAFESPLVEKVVLLKSARVGYAIFLNTIVAWIIVNDPDNIMIVQNTFTDAEKFATSEVGKVFAHCSPVRERMIGKNTLTEKSFFGGEIIVVWATSPSSFRMSTIKYLLMDEVSGYPDDVGKEGDSVDLAITRTESEGRRKIVLGSTPKEAGTCKITREFLLTDQRYLYVPCPHCHVKQRLKLENLRYTAGKYKDAHFVCTHCTKKIQEHHKFNMVEAGEWRATRDFECCGVHQSPEKWDESGSALCCKCNEPGDRNERGKIDAGFHIWSAYNDNPNTSLPSIAAEYEKAKKDPRKMQSFMNTKVGVAYSDASRAHQLNNFEALYQRREYYSPLERLPEQTRCVLATVDTQKNRFEYHIWAIGEREEIWAVDYGQVHGDPEDIATQKSLIHQLEKEFTLSDGRSIGVFAAAMDCNGHAWKAMLEFCAPYQGWIFAIRGESSSKTKFKPEFTLTFKVHPEAKCEYRSLNVHQLKNRAAERLNNEKPGKNYIHFPFDDVFDLVYFQMLTAEELKGSGSNVVWDKKAGQKRNEPWDLLGYVIWLCDFMRPEIKAATPSEPLGLIDPRSNKIPDDIADVEYGDYYETSDYGDY